MDLFEILAFDTDQPSRSVSARRVEIAFVVDLGHSGFEGVFPDQSHLARFVFGGGLNQCPLAHHGLASRLAVNRPTRTVIVRLALSGAVIDLPKNAEAEFWVLIEDLPLGYVVTEMGGD